MKKIEINKIYNQNCIEGMSSIPKNKVDLVITDLHLQSISRQKRQIITEHPLEYFLDIMKSNLQITMILHFLG
jgi:site-specific DNA-methyltransferase (adenine-specific)